MGAIGPLLGILLVLGFLGLMIYLFSAGATSRALNQQERNELNQLRALVDDLKETAWDHRELVRAVHDHDRQDPRVRAARPRSSAPDHTSCEQIEIGSSTYAGGAYAIDKGINPFQPTGNGLIVDQP